MQKKREAGIEKLAKARLAEVPVMQQLNEEAVRHRRCPRGRLHESGAGVNGQGGRTCCRSATSRMGGRVYMPDSGTEVAR